MIVEKIKELTQMEENANVTIDQVLTWARRVKPQKTQSALLNILNETKDFDKISTRKRVQRQIEVQPQEQTRMTMKHKCGYCGYSHLPLYKWCEQLLLVLYLCWGEV